MLPQYIWNWNTRVGNQFTIGAYVNYPFAVSQHPLVNVTAKEEWNKIYINMTSTVSSAINNSFGFTLI